ncbi:hypothetical protein [Anaerocolumna xylanovorans]|uniref:NERD domain-containing protein n=1 Tax=Anaerocolumna xylanovorans DSM 12503 TaxID=1121345 RepID=A0A1M7YL64_9FIRM|nr:hypothetical protein [Anaerocolumna xylanovorans]SHO53336.1 hypothetical protein SAMN02745217_04069 [Anaerocolumna xylanovorans DSM 12503]
MDELVFGLAVSALLVYLLRLISGYGMYKRSVHQMIYSGYLEYVTKRKRIRKLSVSSDFEELFGKSRILYQFYKGTNQKQPLPYIIIILSSGVFCFKICNNKGNVTGNISKKLVQEMNDFVMKLQGKITKISTEIYRIAVFPDQCSLNIADNKVGMAVIKRSQLRQVLIDIHKSRDKELEPWEIDAIWDMLAKDSLALEERKNNWNVKAEA